MRKLRIPGIWRLRNRLMVTYVFVGAVPILLITALAYVITWFVTGQVATYLVSSALARKAAALEGPARFLSEIPADKRPMLGEQLKPTLEARNPGFQIIVTGPSPFRYPANAEPVLPPPGEADFTGVVERNGRYYCMSSVSTGETHASIIAPLTAAVLSDLVPGVGSFNLFTGKSLSSNPRARLQGAPVQPVNALDFEFEWANDLEVSAWDDPSHKTTMFLYLVTRPSAVLTTVLAGRGGFAQVVFLIILAVLGVFELIAIFVGVSMTRTITGAVHNLYDGTAKIAKGDFSHRIPTRGNDQLAELGKSFNQMTEHLERLVVVAKEKERLQSELTIACEVQNQLFPRSAPPMRTIKLMGACEPARSVSGDYYDYLCLPDGNLAFAIGDVAGKGISAALLMASIQSIMRTQLASGVPSPAKLVAQLNKQLYANTSPEKYATFFFGLYDEHSRVLTYTNAGHLPPLVVCGGQARPLEVTGTVVGLFPIAVYEEQSVSLHDHDLLVAYTDGITEPENAYGEEFGAERLADMVLKNHACEPCEIVAKVMEAVKQWSHSDELPDDMTVLIARGIA